MYCRMFLNPAWKDSKKTQETVSIVKKLVLSHSKQVKRQKYRGKRILVSQYRQRADTEGESRYRYKIQISVNRFSSIGKL